MNIRWNARSYTKEQFVEAWLSSNSISEVAHKLKCNRSGSGFYALRNAAESLGLNQDHMPVSRTERTANTVRTRRPLESLLVENSEYTKTSALKEKLYSAGLKEKSCEICGITEWNGLPAPLALDHINGKRNDNRLDNLRVICYNCHGQTETFGSKNKVARLHAG